MIAVLLYLIGLVSVVVTAAMLGLEAPALYESLMAAIRIATAENSTTTVPKMVVSNLSQAAAAHSWVVMPFLGGLLLMGFARIMMLLGAINRAVRQGV